jgi:hypothetical protein
MAEHKQEEQEDGMRQFKVHVYTNITCNFEHKSFATDLMALIKVRDSLDQVNMFINMHTTEYLKAFVERNQPLLAKQLTLNTVSFRGKTLSGEAIRRYLAELPRGEQS